MKISKNFTLEEFYLSPTSIRLGIKNVPNPTQQAAIIQLVEKVLQPIRDHFGLPISVSSGFRCPSLNRAVGGAIGSQHMRGEAADIRVHGLANDVLWSYIKDKLPFDQLILEYVPAHDRHQGWVHVSYAKKLRGEAFSIIARGNEVPGLHFKL